MHSLVSRLSPRPALVTSPGNAALCRQAFPLHRTLLYLALASLFLANGMAG